MEYSVFAHTALGAVRGQVRVDGEAACLVLLTSVGGGHVYLEPRVASSHLAARAAHLRAGAAAGVYRGRGAGGARVGGGHVGHVGQGDQDQARQQQQLHPEVVVRGAAS